MDVAQKNEIAVLFNWMKAELVRREGKVRAVPVGSERSGMDGASSINRILRQQHQPKRRKLTS